MGLKFQNPSFNPMQNSILKQAKVDHEIRQIWFSTRWKKTTWFFTFLDVYVSWIRRDKILGLKSNRKNGVINLVFMSLSWVMVLELSKIICFLQVFADVSQKSKAVIAIYVYASESSRFVLLKNGVGYYAMT